MKNPLVNFNNLTEARNLIKEFMNKHCAVVFGMNSFAPNSLYKYKPIPIIPRASTGSENRWNGPNRGFFRGTDDEKTFVSGRI